MGPPSYSHFLNRPGVVVHSAHQLVFAQCEEEHSQYIDSRERIELFGQHVDAQLAPVKSNVGLRRHVDGLNDETALEAAVEAVVEVDDGVTARVQLLARRLALDVGGGAGLAIGETLDEEPTTDGAALVEAMGFIAYEPRPRIVVMSGLALGLMWNDGGNAEAGSTLPPLPVGRATVLTGLGCRLGGSRRMGR